MQRYRDISEEELAELIARNQQNGRHGKRLNPTELAQGLKMFNDTKSEKDTTKDKVIDILVKILKTIFWPILVFEFIKETRLYKQYTRIVRNAIDNNEEVFDFFERFHFYPAWFTRLYSVQDIPEEFMGVSEETLESLTIQSIMPIRPVLAKANLLTILHLKVERINVLKYVIILEPENFQKCWTLFWWMVGSIGFYILWIATLVILAYNGIV